MNPNRASSRRALARQGLGTCRLASLLVLSLALALPLASFGGRLAAQVPANATFHESHEVDSHSALSFAMDLTPLIDDPTLNVGDFTLTLMRRTEDDISDRIARMNR